MKDGSSTFGDYFDQSHEGTYGEMTIKVDSNLEDSVTWGSAVEQDFEIECDYVLAQSDYSGPLLINGV